MAMCEARWVGPTKLGQSLLASITADDPGSFETELLTLQNDTVELIIRVSADSIGTLRSTMDDLLACLSAVEGSLDVIQN